MSELNAMLSGISLAPRDLPEEAADEGAAYVISLERSHGKWIAVANDGTLPHIIGRASSALGLLLRVWVWTITRKSGYAADA